jgi:2-C-methyl-D-erythritol 4-phosphate cytidylyltransferase
MTEPVFSVAKDSVSDCERGDVWAIVLAAGRGDRYGGQKQYAYAGGHRLVDWSCAAASYSGARVILVVPPEPPHISCVQASRVVVGGPTRILSVRAGLAAVPGGATMIILHDAAHPNAGMDLFAAVRSALDDDFVAAAAVPVVPVNETLVRAGPDSAAGPVIERGSLQVQMPHAYRPQALRAAAASATDSSDEVSALIGMRQRVALVPGYPGNMHVTNPEELALVNVLLSARQPLGCLYDGSVPAGL